MKKILLISLMRMGDILQTTPLIEALRKRYPECQIDMVLNEAFLNTGKRVGLDTLYPFPVRPFYNLVVQEKGFPFQAYSDLQEFLGQVNRDGAYDLVANLTPSRAVAALGSLIDNVSHRGLWMEQDGSFHPTDPWTAYLLTMTANRGTNPFHLVDIWLRTLGERGSGTLQMQLYPEDTRAAQELLVSLGVRPDRELLVGFQVSASDNEKCWSEKEFIRLGQRLHRELNARVLFFGVKEEQGLCERLQAEIPGSVNLAGRTGMGELAAVLQLCRVLITNDTGTQHVATVVGTPVIVISLGPVFFRETGPYGEGHRVIQARLPCAPCAFNVPCLRPLCKEKIRAEHVYPVVVQVLRGEQADVIGPSQDVACYCSRFDEQGFLEFFSQGASGGPEDQKMGLYKNLWKALLEGGRQPSFVDPEECLDPETRAGWVRFEPLLRRASALIKQMKEAGRNREGSSSRWQVLTGNLRSLEREMEQVGLEVIDLLPFVKYLYVRREAISFQDPFLFLEDASSLYALLAEEVMRGIVNPTRMEAIGNGKS